MPPPSPRRSGHEPDFMQAIRGRLRTDEYSARDWAEMAAIYFGMVSRVDDQLGRVLGALDRRGLTDRTVVTFFTDHGEYLGDYGLVEKWPAGVDDCLVRNPLIMAGPGVREGVASGALVEMVDLLPTLCELGEAEVRHRHFGRSLVPLLSGDAESHRSEAFSEGGFSLEEEPLFERAGGYYAYKADLQHERPNLVGRVISVRTPEWTYVHRLYEPGELYDRMVDPREEHNVIDAPEAETVVPGMQERVLRWLMDTSDVIPPEQDPRSEPELIELVRASSRRDHRPAGSE